MPKSQAILMGKSGIIAKGISQKVRVKESETLKKGQFFTCEREKFGTNAGKIVIRPIKYISGTDYSNDAVMGVVLENTKGKAKAKVRFCKIYENYIKSYLTE